MLCQLKEMDYKPRESLFSIEIFCVLKDFHLNEVLALQLVCMFYRRIEDTETN
jgi:hypothetical protein